MPFFFFGCLFSRLGSGQVERLAGLSHVCDVALLHALHDLGRREGAEDVEDPLGHLAELVDLQGQKEEVTGVEGRGWRWRGLRVEG